jgi:hypothetical protein
LIGFSSLALILFAAWRWDGSGSGNHRNFNLGFSLCVLATTLVGYHALPYDLCLLILPVVLILNEYWETTRNSSLSAISSTLKARDWIWLTGPIAVLFLSPLQMVFNFTLHCYHLMAFVLLFWYWGMARYLAQEKSGSAGIS